MVAPDRVVAVIMPSRLRVALERFLRSRGKHAFFASLPAGARVLDIGCGDDPAHFLAQRPDIDYTGIDVTDAYRQRTFSNVAVRHVVVAADRFVEELDNLGTDFDAVISSHNLEHCDDPYAVMVKMIARLRRDGRVFIAFPCAESVRFPRRQGCLNFYDDKTHRHVISFSTIRQTLVDAGLRVDFATPRYRPALLFAVGLLLEPLSALARHVVPGTATWALYGFESIVWATRGT